MHSGDLSRPLGRHFPKLIRRFAADQAGLAFMEFALLLPILMMLLLGGIELVNVALTHQQLSRMATQTADLAARYRSSIDETDIVTLFDATSLSHDLPAFDERGRIVLHSIVNNNNGGHWIRWQRCSGGLNYESSYGSAEDGSINDGDPTNDDDIPEVDGMVVLWPNTVLFAEVVYDYEPLFSLTQVISRLAPVFQPRRLSYRSAFIARELTLQNVTNTSNMSVADQDLCPWNPLPST